jgi:adenylosuccinate synthase
VRASIVVDLGFGDAGKGLLTDFLVRRTGATVVVRYNGGAQAGHNVVSPEGRHHTFAQLGAGSFVPGVRTFLSRHVVVHPTALLAEAAVFALAAGSAGSRATTAADVLSRVRISERALIVTPFHQAAGRLRELARGAARHGSCGVGIGETVADALRWPDEAIVAGDLRDPAALRAKLRRVRERMRAEAEMCAGAAGAAADTAAAAGAAEVSATAAKEAMAATATMAAREWAIFAEDDVAARWLAAAVQLAALGVVVPDATLTTWLAGARAAVFEGAQGVLLDEAHGFHPYTTWSRCTPANALELLAEAQRAGGFTAEVERIGVLRAHAVRHGPGPLPTETAELRSAVVEHNITGAWQGAVRYGWFDAVLARYALDVAGPLEKVALTHLDLPPRLPRWLVCDGYRQPHSQPVDDALVAARSASGAITRLALPHPATLDRQSQLTDLLLRVEPTLEPCGTTAPEIVQRTESLLGRRIDWISRGPRASDVVSADEIRQPI